MKRLAQQSLYEILDIPRNASGDDVEKAYQRARALYGPGSLATYSLMAPEEADFLGRRIEEARSVLTDPARRADYDSRILSGAGLPGPQGPAAAPPLPPIIPPAKVPPQAAEGRPGSAEPARPAAASPAAAVAEAVAAPASPAVVAAAAPPAVATSGAPAAVAAPAAAPFVHPEGAPWTGEVLRRVRESRGITLQQVSERTKVTRYHLENIEADRYDRLPAPVYLRGILMGIAKELRLDGQKVSRSYLELAAAAAMPPAPVPKPR